MFFGDTRSVRSVFQHPARYRFTVCVNCGISPLFPGILTIHAVVAQILIVVLAMSVRVEGRVSAIVAHEYIKATFAYQCAYGALRINTQPIHAFDIRCHVGLANQ